MVEVSYINEIEGVRTLNLDINKLPYQDYKTYLEDRTILDLVKQGIVDLGIFRHTEYKRAYFREIMKDPFFWGKNRTKILLDECSPKRLGEDFNIHYETAKRRFDLHQEVCNA